MNNDVKVMICGKEFRLRTDMVDKANEMMEKAGMISRRITVEDLLP